MCEHCGLQNVEEPMQKGIDIHEFMISLLPRPTPGVAVPNNGPPIPDRRGYRPRKSDWSNVVASRGITSPLAKKANDKFGIRTNGKSSQPKVTGARSCTPSEERSQENLGIIKKGKRPVRDSDPFAYKKVLENHIQELENASLKEKQPNDSCKKEHEEDFRIAESHGPLQLQQTSRREKLQQLSGTTDGTEQTKSRKLKEVVELSSEEDDEDWENLQRLTTNVKHILHQK